MENTTRLRTLSEEAALEQSTREVAERDQKKNERAALIEGLKSKIVEAAEKLTEACAPAHAAHQRLAELRRREIELVYAANSHADSIAGLRRTHEAATSVPLSEECILLRVEKEALQKLLDPTTSVTNGMAMAEQLDGLRLYKETYWPKRQKYLLSLADRAGQQAEDAEAALPAKQAAVPLIQDQIREAEAEFAKLDAARESCRIAHVNAQAELHRVT